MRTQVVVVSPKESSHEYKVLTWGRGSYGQLGHGSGRIKIPDKQVRFFLLFVQGPCVVYACVCMCVHVCMCVPVYALVCFSVVVAH